MAHISQLSSGECSYCTSQTMASRDELVVGVGLEGTFNCWDDFPSRFGPRIPEALLSHAARTDVDGDGEEVKICQEIDQRYAATK